MLTAVYPLIDDDELEERAFENFKLLGAFPVRTQKYDPIADMVVFDELVECKGSTSYTNGCISVQALLRKTHFETVDKRPIWLMTNQYRMIRLSEVFRHYANGSRTETIFPVSRCGIMVFSGEIPIEEWIEERVNGRRTEPALQGG